MSPSNEIITQLNDNDIILGRRGKQINRQPGNMAYRKVVNSNKLAYATCERQDKIKISKSIVGAMRQVGGRFLEQIEYDANTVAYRDIGDKEAVQKTSQALREGQSKLFKKLQNSPSTTQSSVVSSIDTSTSAAVVPSYHQAVFPPLQSSAYSYDGDFVYGSPGVAVGRRMSRAVTPPPLSAPALPVLPIPSIAVGRNSVLNHHEVLPDWLADVEFFAV
eukprot:716436_1